MSFKIVETFIIEPIYNHQIKEYITKVIFRNEMCNLVIIY